MRVAFFTLLIAVIGVAMNTPIARAADATSVAERATCMSYYLERTGAAATPEQTQYCKCYSEIAEKNLKLGDRKAMMCIMQAADQYEAGVCGDKYIGIDASAGPRMKSFQQLVAKTCKTPAS